MNPVHNYMGVTASYWGFTLTDGALRMLVLLHLHELGFSPFDLAIMFLLYEAMGIVTNFFGGWIGARFGLRLTLNAGLSVQIIALSALSFLDPNWQAAFSVAFVMITQALSGVAKDLTKMSSKSAIKLVVKNEGTLFKWVAFLTGSKNTLKGIGFFMGGVLLQVLGFQQALWAMAAGLLIILICSIMLIKGDIGKVKEKITGKALFSKTPQINVLSFARLFLFGARDIWFVVALPLFFATQLGWRHDQVGLFMASWVIGYGIVQAFAPKLFKKDGTIETHTKSGVIWGGILFLVTGAMVGGIQIFEAYQSQILIGGLLLFGAIFAVNSSLHSYLIVALSDKEKIALNVGFYYMANAAGRFVGTFLSGLTYQFAGLTACLIVSAAMIFIAAISLIWIKPEEQSYLTG